MNFSILSVVLLLAGAILAIRGLFRPFLGMIVFIIIHFVQPGELMPALEPLRIELVYGMLLIASLIYRRSVSSVRSLFSNRIVVGALVLLGAAILSIPFALWVGGAANSVIELAKLIALIVLLTLLVDSRGQLRIILWCLVAVGTWFAGSSLSAYLNGQALDVQYDWGSFSRAEGVNSIVGGPNELAGLLLALFPLLIVLLRCSRNIFVRILLIASGAVSMAAIALTGSRIAMIGLSAIAIYYILQSKRKLLTLIACVVIGCVFWTSLPTVYKQRYLTVQSYASGGELDASNELRLEIWKAGRKIFFYNPVVGVGAGQFSTAYGLIYLGGEHKAWMNPHNLLIQIACELGVIGFAAFCYFFWQIVEGIKFALQKRTPKTELNYQTAIATSVMCVGVLLLSVVGHTLYRPYWYLLAGLVAANRNIVLSTFKERSKSGAASLKEPKRVTIKPGRPRTVAEQVLQRIRKRQPIGKRPTSDRIGRGWHYKH